MKYFLVCLSICIFSCDSQKVETLSTAVKPDVFSDDVSRAQLIGAWLGESPVKDGSTVKWLLKRASDGTYKVQFRITDARKMQRDQFETGFWGISGGVYFTLTRAMIENGRLIPVDTKDASFYDAYKILSSSPSEFKYKSLSTQEVFTVKRVANDFSW